jgi:hypothetical protein
VLRSLRFKIAQSVDNHCGSQLRTTMVGAPALRRIGLCALLFGIARRVDDHCGCRLRTTMVGASVLKKIGLRALLFGVARRVDEHCGSRLRTTMVEIPAIRRNAAAAAVIIKIWEGRRGRESQNCGGASAHPLAVVGKGCPCDWLSLVFGTFLVFSAHRALCYWCLCLLLFDHTAHKFLSFIAFSQL